MNPVFGQNYGLKIVIVKDSSTIDSDLKNFDSVWNNCMAEYGKNDVSKYFLNPHTSIQSKSHPITVLNFITGIDYPFNMVFPFRMVNKVDVNDSLKMYQLDMGWMHISILFHSKFKKLVQVSDINYFNLKTYYYKNLTIYSDQKTMDMRSVQQSYNDVLNAMDDLGIERDSFLKKHFTIYSANTLSEVYRYVGGLEYVNYFNQQSRFGGMGDPFNNILLSGVERPIHTHELVHFAVNFQTNRFIGEGIASLYGGVGIESYQSKIPKAVELMVKYNIHSFKDLNEKSFIPEINSNRVPYVLSAHLLNSIKLRFRNKETFRKFVRSCKTDEQMISSLMELLNAPSEETVFLWIFYKIK